MSTNTTAEARNEDPITGAPGAHPVGVGVGATGGGLTGATIGAMGGPVGMAVGAAIGAVVGGLAGKTVAEDMDPTVEDAYWAENYTGEGYVDPTGTFNDYGPAYRTGYLGYGSGKHATFQEAESELQRHWEATKGDSKIDWEKARHASRAAWERLQKSRRPDKDNDPLVTLENVRE